MASDSITFLKELRTSFKSIGAMCPSSPLLGRAMAFPVRNQGRPLNILEVGPGTGPVTRQILRFMGPQDRFLICELNHRFITRLHHTLQKNREFIRNRDRIDFFEGPVQDLYRGFFAGEDLDPLEGAAGIFDGSKFRNWPTQSFDVIVSTLPFSNFTPEMVEEIMSIFRSMLAENGVISYVEYFMIRKVSLLFATPEDRARIKAVDKVMERWGKIAKGEGGVRRKLSLMNIPPALSIQCRYGDEIRSQEYRRAGARS